MDAPEKKKTSDTPASRIWLVSHVRDVGLEPKPDTSESRSNG